MLHIPGQLQALPVWSEFLLQREPTKRAEGSPLAVGDHTADSHTRFTWDDHDISTTKDMQKIKDKHVCMSETHIETTWGLTFNVFSSFAQLLSRKRYSENHIDQPMTCTHILDQAWVPNTDVSKARLMRLAMLNHTYRALTTKVLWDTVKYHEKTLSPTTYPQRVSKNRSKSFIRKCTTLKHNKICSRYYRSRNQMV